jgi:hypothetical protein
LPPATAYWPSARRSSREDRPEALRQAERQLQALAARTGGIDADDEIFDRRGFRGSPRR